MICIIRIRRGVPTPAVRKTLELLRLSKANTASLAVDSPQLRGMLVVCRDFVSWGQISDAMVKRLEEKKGKSEGKVRSFHLRPPTKGYRSIKRPYPSGSIGDRGDIEPLLKRMI